MDETKKELIECITVIQNTVSMLWMEELIRIYSPNEDGSMTIPASVVTYCLSQISSEHRLGRGLPGYLILFAPHAFVHERQ